MIEAETGGTTGTWSPGSWRRQAGPSLGPQRETLPTFRCQMLAS